MNHRNRIGAAPAVQALLVGMLALAPAHAQELTLGKLLGGLKNALAKPADAPAAAPQEAAAGGQGMAGALPRYTALVRSLAARNDLPAHQWQHTYLLDRQLVQEYTPTTVPGMYSLRNVRPDDPAEAKRWAQSGGIFFEWQPIVFFTADGSGFYVRKDNFMRGEQAWIVYDDKNGGYKTGEAARPYIQQMLTNMDTRELPAVGRERPTFILYTSPSCPYSLKAEAALEKSGLSYRVFPTHTINPGQDMQAVHRIFCADDKLAAWKKALQAKGKHPNSSDGSWWCSPTVMPVLTIADLDFVFGQGYPTPSYYFADGTVITGLDLEAVKAKSRAMQAKGLYFN